MGFGGVPGPLPGLFMAKKPAVNPGRAPPKDKKMRGIQWNKLKGKALKESIFANITVNDDELKLDFSLLDKLWCKPPKVKKKKKKNEEKKAKKRTTMEFLDEMDDDGKKGRVANITIKALKKTAEEYRDCILTMSFAKNDNPEDVVTAITKIVPTEDHMAKFLQKTKKHTLEDVKYYAVGERLWFYCRKIPLVSLRCELWTFKLQFKELLEDQYK